MFGAWLAAKADTRGISNSSENCKKSYSPTWEKATARFDAEKIPQMPEAINFKGMIRDRNPVRLNPRRESEHPIIAHGKINQRAYRDH